jgi:hypothetical protein
VLFSSDIVRIASASTVRKDDCSRRLRYYWDQQSEDTFELIARRWSRPEQFRIFSVNIVRAITNRRANTYRIQPRRVFSGVDQASMDVLYRAMNADAVLKKASRYTKLCKTAVLQVGFNQAAGTPTLNVVTPNVLDVLYSNPENPERIIVTHGAARAEDVTYSDWTATGFRHLNYRGAARRIDGNPGNTNPYGVLPFVPLFDRLPDDQFFIRGGSDLMEAQDAVNVALANLWRSVETQAHGQAWASGISANEVLQFGPDRAIALPQGGQFGFASPNSPIASILSAIEFVLRQTAATHGVGSDIFDLSKVAESGSAKHAGRIELREERLDDIAQWRIAEARLFAVLKAVVNTHGPGTIPDAATVAIDFAELQDSLTEAEQLGNARDKIDLGLWSPADALMALNPDGFPDRAAAMRELQSRRDESAALALPL